MLVLSLLLLGASAQKQCERYFWRGQCTACPGYWYQSCGGGNYDAGQRGCGFLGCETQCRDPDGNGVDYGCGCGKGQGCLKKNCAVSAWGNWGNCSKTCGGGKQTRTRKVTQQPANGGAECPPLSQDRTCNTSDCPTPAPTASPTDTACPEFVLAKHSLKGKGKTETTKFTGKNAEEVLCKCENKCKGTDGAKYWTSKLNKSGTKGSCVCYTGKLRKVKAIKSRKNGAIGAVNEANMEAINKKTPKKKK